MIPTNRCSDTSMSPLREVPDREVTVAGQADFHLTCVSCFSQVGVSFWGDTLGGCQAREEHPMRILIVEDNHRLSHELRQSLMYEGYAVDLAYDGDAGLAFAESAPYDAMILDVLLPIQDGLEVCHTLRQHGCTIPILMLTARDALDDRVRG